MAGQKSERASKVILKASTFFKKYQKELTEAKNKKLRKENKGDIYGMIVVFD